MFDNLLKLVTENASDAIINNNAIPNEKNNEAINLTSNSIFDTLKSQASGGNMNDILSMFNSGSSSSVNNAISSNVVQSLSSKLNIEPQQAQSVANTLIPQVMNQLVKKTNDPSDSSFDLKDIMGSLGGNMGGLDSLFK
ncbi:MAG: DUF937 domain-containing protein [Bacteroidetes bacterium]|nr:DUF937 domain-containing protein [Bacteroidota bacterium]